MARATFTPDKAKYIKDNYNYLTLVVMARNLNIGKSTIQRWCKKLGLCDERKKVPPTHARASKKQKGPIKLEIKESRPSTSYSNLSREQHIDRILNMAI